MVSTQSSFIDFSADGLTNTFTFPFFTLSGEYIFARVRGVEHRGEVTVNANRVGGKVRLFFVPHVDDVVRIFRRTPLEQGISFAYNSELPAKDIEAALDRQVCWGQEQRNELAELLAQNRQLLHLKQGPKGDKGDDGLPAGVYQSIVFCAAATAPAAPVSITGPVPEGWSDAPPPDTGLPIWSSLAQIDSAGFVVGVWSTPVRWNAPAGPWTSFVYKLAATAPVAPTSTNPVPSGEGWVSVRDQPETDVLHWYITSSQVVAGLAVAWSVPVRLTGEDGENGANADWEDRIYSVGTGDVVPPRPQGVNPVAAAGSVWHDVPPAVGVGQRLYISTMWRSGTSEDVPPAPVVLPPVWSVPAPMTGNAGAKGNWVTEVFCASPTRPPTPTTTDAIPTGWVDWINRTKDDDGKVLTWWRTSNVISGATGTAIDPDKWAVPVLAVGRDGDNLFTIYKAAVTPPNPPLADVFPDTDAFAASGWSYTPPELSGEQVAWMSKGVFDLRNQVVIKAWTPATRVSGEGGEDGAVSVPLLKVFNPLPDGTLSINAPDGFGEDWTESYALWASQGWYRSVNQEQSHGIIYQTTGILNAYGTGFFAVGGVWVTPFRITGENGNKGDAGNDGQDGVTTQVVFKMAPAAPALPVGDDLNGWTAATPTASAAGYALYLASRIVRGEDVISDWTGPQRLSGFDGPRGAPGLGGVTTAAAVLEIPQFWTTASVTAPVKHFQFNLTGGVVQLTAWLRVTGISRNGDASLLAFDLSAIGAENFPPLPQGIVDAGLGIPAALRMAKVSRNSSSDEPSAWLVLSPDRQTLRFTFSSDVNFDNPYTLSQLVAGSVIAVSATYNLNTPPPDDDYLPLINTQPADLDAIADEAAEIYVGADGIPFPEYEWQFSADEGQTWTVIAGATSAALRFPSIEVSAAGQYRVRVHNKLGSVFSDAAVVTVQPNTAPLAPVIDMQPADTVFNGPTQMPFVVAHGRPTALTYQWYRSTGINPSGDYTIISGATGATASGLDAPTYPNFYYARVVVTNGTGSTISRNLKVSSVNPNPPIL